MIIGRNTRAAITMKASFHKVIIDSQSWDENAVASNKSCRNTAYKIHDRSRPDAK